MKIDCVGRAEKERKEKTGACKNDVELKKDMARSYESQIFQIGFDNDIANCIAHTVRSGSVEVRETRTIGNNCGCAPCIGDRRQVDLTYMLGVALITIELRLTK